MEKKLIDWRDVATIFGIWGLFYGILSEFESITFKYRIATFGIPLCGIIIYNQLKIWKRKDYQLLTRGKNSGTAEEYKKHIIKAKDYIWMTHFRSEAPTQSYIETLDLLRAKGVKIRRIVNVRKEELSKYDRTKWILEELEKENTNHKFIEFDNTKLSYEIISIDGKTAAIALPTKDALHEGELANILSSQDKKFIASIESMFNEYWK